MPFFPNALLSSKKYPRNIKHMPAVIFSDALILDKTFIFGQPPRTRHPYIQTISTFSTLLNFIFQLYPKFRIPATFWDIIDEERYQKHDQSAGTGRD